MSLRARCPVSCETLAAALAFFLSASALANPEARHLEDRADIDVTRVKHPRAVERLERGETELAAGRVQAAAELFKQAREEAPRSSLAARRHCQALVELGQREEALRSCTSALANGGTVFDGRALVAALMMGNSPPTTEELTMAGRLIQTAKERMPHQPWGYAAQCDVARRLGDRNLIRRCAADLERVVPGHYETERALRLASESGEPWWRWFGRAALAAIGAFTAAHAIRRILRQRARAFASGIFIALGLGLVVRPAHAAEGNSSQPPASTPAGGLSKWGINHADPIQSLPTKEQRDKNPIQFGYHLMDLTEAGDAATKRGDHHAAVKYYQALAKAVPDVSRPYLKACESYVAMRDRQKAIEWCTFAISFPGVRVVDYGLYAKVVLSKEGRLSAEEVNALLDVVEHLKKDEKGADLATRIQCDVGLRMENVGLLEACTDALREQAPDDPRTLTHRFALAIARKNVSEAQHVIEVAKHTAMPPEAIQQMEQSASAAVPLWRRAAGDWRIATVVAIVLLAAAVVFRTTRRRSTELRPA